MVSPRGEFLLLGKECKKPFNHTMLCSEKMDGTRAVWLPFLRGERYEGNPFENLTSKNKPPSGLCTGLFTRYGNVINAPDSFLDTLPDDMILDGELWNPGLSWEEIRSDVAGHNPAFAKVKLWAFDSPRPSALFQSRTVKSPQCLMKINHIRGGDYDHHWLGKYRLSKHYWLDTINWLPDQYDYVSEQFEMNYREAVAWAKDIAKKGGEGVMARAPSPPWEGKRADWLLKLKPRLDSEGMVLELVPGEGRLAGTTGAVVVQCEEHNVTFKIGTGLTNQERSLIKVGDRITFTYRKLSDAGVPVEAAFKGWRDHE